MGIWRDLNNWTLSINASMGSKWVDLLIQKESKLVWIMKYRRRSNLGFRWWAIMKLGFKWMLLQKVKTTPSLMKSSIDQSKNLKQDSLSLGSNTQLQALNNSTGHSRIFTQVRRSYLRKIESSWSRINSRRLDSSFQIAESSALVTATGNLEWTLTLHIPCGQKDVSMNRCRRIQVLEGWRASVYLEVLFLLTNFTNKEIPFLDPFCCKRLVC